MQFQRGTKGLYMLLERLQVSPLEEAWHIWHQLEENGTWVFPSPARDDLEYYLADFVIGGRRNENVKRYKVI